MNSSSSSLSSDWDVLSQNSVAGNSIDISLRREPLPLMERNGTKSRADDKICPPAVSGVDDINDALNSNQDHNTSSDIEVIEETLEDLIQSPVPTMKYSINSSLIADSPDSSIPPPVPVELGWTMLFRLFQRNLENSFQRLQEDFQLTRIILCLIIVFVSVYLASALNFYGAPSNDMKDQIEILKKENDYLKNQAVSSKTESEKLFLILEEQIKAMRSENQKISKSMQSLRKNMEEQSSEKYRESPNCFVNFFRCFSATLPKWPTTVPKWW
ncbi:hypothetical protein JTE90_024862 [Oedothorax gibbosus]|uniref:Uncharacterized protein n=1 Tax=Oedothorax gibbosus TaxID=931172 RepID=A0AAV6V2M6_9ARAC|nr:hypothetical protein JTE90_024862 [Oedothorax gibbosus]